MIFSKNTKILTAISFLIIGLILTLSGLLLSSSKEEPIEQVQVVTSTPTLPEQAVTPTSEVDTLGVEGQEVLVTSVIDGDTIEIASGEKVRYIGIDTPETVDPRRPVGCFGKEASAENKRLVEGKKVILVKDVSETDRFRRLLRYVYVKDGNSLLFVNDYLIREGFARSSTFPPDVKFSDQFLQAEREAREASRGLWGKCN